MLKKWYLEKYLNTPYLARHKATYLINGDGDRIDITRDIDIENLISDGYYLVVDIEKIPEHIVKNFNRGILTVGLFKGRHDLPVENYVFTEEVDPTDVNTIDSIAGKYFGVLRHNFDIDIHTINIYVTGLTVGLIAAIKGAKNSFPNAKIYAWHYNRETGDYFKQLCF